ncbi:MAG TPA: FUSC family protein [Acidisarcina sp.]|nr:FUSC family protein [Acidisarcina sp.]
MYLIFLISYDTPYLTFTRYLGMLACQCSGVAAAFLLIAATNNDPLARVLGVAFFSFIAAFIRRTSIRYFPVTDFAVFGIGCLAYFEYGTPAERAVHLSMWPIATGFLAVGSKLAVEYTFTRRDPVYALRREIEARLLALEQMFSSYASMEQDPIQLKAQISQVKRFAFAGQAKMQGLLQEVKGRHMEKDIFPHVDISALIPMLARVLDQAAAFAVHNAFLPSSANREQLDRIRQCLADIREGKWQQARQSLELSTQLPTRDLDLLEAGLEALTASFSEEASEPDEVLQPETPNEPKQTAWLLPDAFTNLEYTSFATKIMLCAVICHVIYNAIAWQGISTAVITVLVAGLTSAGAFNQKLIFRFLGSAIGGVVFGLGCIIFLFPYVDTATPFLIVVAAVSFLAAWISRSPHLSYIGMQMAFSFYFVVFENFAPTSTLTGGRDRLAGILLALFVMWLIFRPEKSIHQMRQTFAKLLALQADYLRVVTSHQLPAATRRVRGVEMRDEMERTVISARALAELITYEFGQNREQDIQISEKIQRAISSSGNLLLSIIHWHESGIPLTDASLEQSQIALENGLRSLSALVGQNQLPAAKPGEGAELLPRHAPQAMPPSIEKSFDLYRELDLQCRSIVLP